MLFDFSDTFLSQVCQHSHSVFVWAAEHRAWLAVCIALDVRGLLFFDLNPKSASSCAINKRKKPYPLSTNIINLGNIIQTDTERQVVIDRRWKAKSWQEMHGHATSYRNAVAWTLKHHALISPVGLRWWFHFY